MAPKIQLYLLLVQVLCGIALAADNGTGTPIAVSVARTTPLTTSGFPVSFPDIVVDLGDAWSQSESTLSIKSDSVFFFNMNAGANKGKRINMNLEGTYFFADVLRMSSSHNGSDTTGRSFITLAQEGSTVYVSSDPEFELYSDGGRQTSFTALELSSHLTTPDHVIFSVARRTSFSVLDTIIPFDDILLNEGDAFNKNTSEFKVAKAGVYFLVCSMGIDKEQSMTVSMYQGTKKLTQLYREHTNHNGQDTVGTAVLVNLPTDATISLKLEAGQVYSDGLRQAFFGGFLYQPSLVSQAAWCVYKTMSSQPADPLVFDNVHLNEQNMYNATDNLVYITVPGVYYVSLTVGALPYIPVDAFVVRDSSRAELNVYRESTSHAGFDTLSQGTLLRLSAGNTLRVVIREGSGIYSDGAMQTVFSGFLIAP